MYLLMGCNCNGSCSCTTDLGCVDPCGNLELEDTASYTGTYTLKVGYLGSTVKVESAQTVGEPIAFPLAGLNENFTFTAEILEPDGESLGFIKFTTSPVIYV